ncbi:nitrous oxide reductase accessory protein NosL [Halomicrococcus gelatinilyticus]|uniref:nitrous oxide reductase accessory protein NosL n=1 Tax=Halomicrococcus gelatinilyticus TaxID=1702103 RepID=UPI002E146825
MVDDETDAIHDLTRRTALRAGLLGVGAALAGCVGSSGTDEETTSTTDRTSTGQPTTSTATEGTDAAAAKPETPGEEESCAVCKMYPAKFPDYNAQLLRDDGEHVHFCSTGCMTAYTASPGTFQEGVTRDDVDVAWAHDHATKELTRASEAYFVLETDADRVDDPMMKNPLAFADEGDATDYVDQYDDLSTDDVVRYDDFDVELAKQYRGKFFE